MRTIVLPVAMALGAVLSGVVAPLNAFTPYLLFVMLLVTFCRISPAGMRFSRSIAWLIGVQIMGGIVVFLALSGIDRTLAQGVAMCVYAPTGVASMVIGAMLGADATRMATMTFFSNITVGLLSPVLFAAAGGAGDVPFGGAMLAVVSRVGPLLLIPLAAAMVLRKIWPRGHAVVARNQGVSFWLWSVALTVTTAHTVEFIRGQGRSAMLVAAMACGAAVVCVGQLMLGRWLGRRFGDAVSGGQSLLHKNTLLAIWMTQTYFSPLASVGPAAYVIWQNLANTIQLWRHSARIKVK